MKDFKPMRELINAIFEIAKAIKGESSDSGSETKNNKIIGLNGPDKILVWASPFGGEQEHQFLDTYQELKSFAHDHIGIIQSVFVYKNNDLNVDDTLMYSSYNNFDLPDYIMIKEHTEFSKRFIKLSEWQSNLDVSKIEDADKWYVLVQDVDESSEINEEGAE